MSQIMGMTQNDGYDPKMMGMTQNDLFDSK